MIATALTRSKVSRSRVRPSPNARVSKFPLSNPDKVFWPDEGYTKLDLAAHYHTTFPRLRPYVMERLLSLERCPDGMLGDCFYQKEKPKGMPPDTPTRPIRHARRTTTYVVGGRLETQLALVNLGCIPVHVWSSRAPNPRLPDWVCFDLDPGSGGFAEAARAGLKVKRVLDELGLISFPKTSGGKGLHVFVPIRTGPDADEVLAFASAIGGLLAKTHPQELTVEPRKAARRGRVYLDAFRNAFAQTVVAPYSVRRRPRAPVSTPLDWSEVKPTLKPERFNLGNFERRLAEPDPWASFFRRRQSLKAAITSLARA